MASWGDLNARLNRLVREGVIAGFHTNLPAKPTAGLTVTVVPNLAAAAGVADRSAHADAVRRRVSAALSAVAPRAAIVVECAEPVESSGPWNTAQFG